MIGARLKEERERLGLTQPDFAGAAGAKKRTLIDWEKGVSSPTAVQLSALSAIGVDVLYILTGVRKNAYPFADAQSPATAEPRAGSTVTETSPRERALLDNYRECTEEDRSFIDKMALRSAEAQHTEVSDKPKRKAM